MGQSTEEYTWLRQHIYGQFRLVAQVFTASIIAVGALLGYIISNLYGANLAASSSGLSITPFLSLAPLAIAIPCAYFVGALRKEIFKWGMYIEVYLEGKNNWRYETELAKYRIMFPERESFNPIAITYWVFAVVCGLLFWWSLTQANMSYFWLLFLTIPFIVLGVWYIDYKDIPYRYSEQYRKNWIEVKASSQGGNMGTLSSHCRNGPRVPTSIESCSELYERIAKLFHSKQKQQSLFTVGIAYFPVGVALLIFGYQTIYKHLTSVGIWVMVVSVGLLIWSFILGVRSRKG